MFIKKFAAIAVCIIIVLNLVLMALGKINPLTFWFIIILGAIIAFGLFPKRKI